MQTSWENEMYEANGSLLYMWGTTHRSNNTNCQAGSSGNWKPSLTKISRRMTASEDENVLDFNNTNKIKVLTLMILEAETFLAFQQCWCHCHSVSCFLRVQLEEVQKHKWTRHSCLQPWGHGKILLCFLRCPCYNNSKWMNVLRCSE